MKSKVPLLTALFLFSVALADDWPDWRGQSRAGIWRESGITESLPNPPRVIWSVPVGPGYTGPTVANGRVFLMDRIDKPEQERVLCFDEKNGNLLWSYNYPAEYRSVGYPAGPRACVVVDGDRAYSLGTVGHLHCFDVKSGQVLWKKDLDTQFNIKMPIWGIAAAPLIVGDKLVLHIGGRPDACVVALDKQTGETRWKALGEEASYSAPILIKQAGKQVVVVWSGESLSGLDPETGKLYWRIPFDLKMRMGIATPLLYKNYIFVSGFFDGSLLVRLNQKKLFAETVWQRSGKNERNTDALHCCINTPVILDNYIYGIDSYGELRCLELLTGDRTWEDLSVVHKDRWANVNFTQHGDKVWMFNEHGELLITKLAPDGLSVISRVKVIEPTTEQLSRRGQGVTWSPPAFANRKMFVRNDKELRCIDLSL